MDVLELEDRRDRAWFDGRGPRLHLLLGDSVARDGWLESRLPRDRFLHRARSSETWESLEEDLTELLDDWRREARRQGRQLGNVVIWNTGNDVYRKSTGRPNSTEEVLQAVAGKAIDVVQQLQGAGAERIVVLGPLARWEGELTGTEWQQTAAFHLERRLANRLPGFVQLVKLGRQLTRKQYGRQAITLGCRQWYQQDGVHISPAGYAKLADAEGLPLWMRLGAAAEA